jgi:hypothetical protein
MTEVCFSIRTKIGCLGARVMRWSAIFDDTRLDSFERQPSDQHLTILTFGESFGLTAPGWSGCTPSGRLCEVLNTVTGANTLQSSLVVVDTRLPGSTVTSRRINPIK